MSEMGTTFWPGQVSTLVFSLEQLKAIASSSRSSVFWSYNPRVPQSTSEVGLALGRSSQSVRYHTNELIKCGLLLAVETRRRRARTEEAYVIAGITCVTAAPPVDAAYLLEKRRGFQALWRQFDRDRAAINLLENVDPSRGSISRFNLVTPRLTPEQLRAFQDEVGALMEKYLAMDDPMGTRTRLVSFASPTMGATAREYLRLTGNQLRIDGDTDD